MTLAELLKEKNGHWEDGAAIFQGAGGYYTRVAVGSPENFTLTTDGERLLAERTPKAKPVFVVQEEAKAPVDTSADVIKSSTKKRGRKGTHPSADELDLDDF